MLTLLYISVLWFKGSNHTIYWGTNWLKKSFQQIRDEVKKRQKYWKTGNEISTKDSIEALKYKSCLSFHACLKNCVEFTDSTHTIYWPIYMATKAANCWKKIFIYMSVLNTFQYKQFLCILTLSKCNW